MGIGIVLLFWLVAGSMAAVVGALILAVGMAALTPSARPGRRKAIVQSAALPFIGLCWFAGLFVFQAVVNEAVFHRDPGLGDFWQAPLPNGYFLTMIDVTDSGWVTKLAQQEMGPKVSDLQVAGRYVLGRYAEDPMAGQYFLLDTGAEKTRYFASLEDLRKAAQPLGIEPKLEPFNDIYRRYRSTWFDDLVLFLFLAYPAGAMVFWVRCVRAIRREPILAAA